MKSIHTQKTTKITFASVTLASVLCAISIIANASAEDLLFTVTNNAVIQLTVPSLVNLNLYPTTGSDFNTASMDISVGTNNPTGYTLTMTADSDTLTHIGSVIDSGSGNPYTPTILPILTTGSATGYTAAQFESSSTDAYTLNRWGYKLSTATNFMPMTTTTTELSTANAPSNGDTVTLDFAAKVDTTKPAGTYQTTLNFTAVTNAVPISNIADLTYMQEFATLTSSELADVLASMTVGAQYQLKDNRDEKPYYISKLADGNVWMTQNLDHDIVTTANFYTPQNTDIPATWTAQTATYATNNTTWSSTANNPESYDPGDLCWNGTIAPDYNGTLSTYAEACGNDKHYHIGNYYNWTAAVAMNDSSSFTTDQQDVDQSICPAGWRLPTYSGDKSYANLRTTLSLTAGTSGNVQSAPAYFVYGGYWDGESVNVGGSGAYWSSVVNDGYNAYDFLFFMDGLMIPQGDEYRVYGVSVRCVARSPKTIQSLTYMQDFATLTSKEKTEVLSSMTQNQQYQLKDNRDQKDYYVSKLADGNVWMTQNLDHDIVTTTDFYTYANTDIGHGSTPNTQATWTASTATYATGVTTWDNASHTTPQSYDPGNVCWSGTTQDSTTVSCNQNGSHFHLGNFYNWTAAVAMNDGSSYTTNGTDVDQSICPAGWTLPKDGSITTSGSFQYLVTQYGWDSDDEMMTGDYSMWSSPLYFPLSGLWSGSLDDVGDFGYYWSSVVYDITNAYGPYYDHDGNVDPDASGYRRYGNSVRCVAR